MWCVVWCVVCGVWCGVWCVVCGVWGVEYASGRAKMYFVDWHPSKLAILFMGHVRIAVFWGVCLLHIKMLHCINACVCRLMEFEERYNSFEDVKVNGKKQGIPPFHYGSHYSSAGIVLYYLVRRQPFTSLSKDLQGG